MAPSIARFPRWRQNPWERPPGQGWRCFGHHERQARNPRACPRRGREPPARPAENPTQSGDQHRDCQHQPCHGRYCGSRDCGPIPVPAWPVKHPNEGARRVQDRPRGYEEDVAAGCSSYTHPQNRQRPGRAPDLVRSRPRPEPPDHRPRLSANIRSRSTSGRDGTIHAERPFPYQHSLSHGTAAAGSP